MKPVMKPFLIVVAMATLLVNCSRSPEQRVARYLTSGRAFLEKQDYASALLQFKNAASELPGKAEPFYYMGVTYIATAHAKEAVECLLKATQLNPKYVDAQIKLAELMVLSHQQSLLRQAQQRLDAIVADHPDNSDALALLAAVEFRGGDLRDAENYLNEALEQHPDHLQSATALASLKLSQKNWTAAEEILKQAASRSPHSPDPIVALGELYLFRGDKAKAEDMFRSALQIEPNHVPALAHMAAASVEAGRMAEAEAAYRRLATLSPGQFGQIYPAFLLEQGKLQQAIAAFQAVLRDHPDNRGVRTSLVAAYLKANRPAEAEAILNQAVEGNPKDIGVSIERARLWLHLGKYADARQALATVLEYQPASAEAHALLAEVYRNQNSVVQQRQELNEALRRNPALLPARLELAQAMIRDKTPHDALTLLDHAPAEQRHVPALLAARNWTLLALGDLAGFNQGIAAGLATRQPEFLVQAGVYKLMKKDYAGARQSLEAALAQNPKDTRALEALAHTYIAQKHPELWLEKIRSYAAQQPHSPEIQLFAGNWYARNQRFEEAKTAFVAALAASPGYIPAEHALARLYITGHQYDMARPLLTRLLAANSQDVTAHLLLAATEESAGNIPEAILQYRKVVELSPADVLSLNNLAYLLSNHSSQLDEALTYAQRAKEIAPDDPTTDDTLGWVFCRKGIYQSALQYLGPAAAKGGALPKYHLAIAYFKAGDLSLGKRMLEAAIRVDPNSAEAAPARLALAEASSKPPAAAIRR